MMISWLLTLVETMVLDAVLMIALRPRYQTKIVLSIWFNLC